MSAIQPVAVYAMRIPPGDIMVPAVPEFATMFRVTMAAIDPSEEIETQDVDHKGPPRATLKVIRIADDMLDDEDSEDDEDYLDGLEDDDDSEEDDEEENGGPSNKKEKLAKLLKALAEDEEDEDDEDEDMEDDEDELDAAEELKKLIKGKGKGKALTDDDEDDSEDDVDSEEAVELDEVVLCTLDPEKIFQQPVDFVVGEGEKIFFKVSGTHTVHLTGNYVMPVDDGRTSLYDDEDEEDEYDLSPDEDELDELDALVNGDEESDELDDLEDPRITEVASEDEAPKLVKGKNKRPADDSEDEEAALDAMMAKSIKNEEAATNGDAKKLSKAEKKKAKKLKKNDGEAAPVENTKAATPEVKKEAAAATNGSEKKVQFSKDLVQGPTPSATPPAKKEEKKSSKDDGKPAAPSTSASLGVRDISGVTVDDRKIGSGPAAKKGSKLDLRYIGKLENGKVFDSNKSGKPFSLKLGQGEVIKGWDLGLQGISAGGERRLTIPANLAYGNKALPGIPKNSKLIFDVKCLSVK